MIDVLIADQCPLVLLGLREVLADALGSRASGEASSGSEVIEQSRSGIFDAVVLDPFSLESGGIDLIERLRTIKPSLPVLVMDDALRSSLATRLFAAGANGYLRKRASSSKISGAVRKVAEGKQYVDSEVAQKLVAYLGEEDDPPHAKLSDREFQVMVRIAEGESTDEIAQALALSPKTISTYRSRISKKLELRNDVEIARYSLSREIVTVPSLA